MTCTVCRRFSSICSMQWLHAAHPTRRPSHGRRLSCPVVATMCPVVQAKSRMLHKLGGGRQRSQSRTCKLTGSLANRIWSAQALEATSNPCDQSRSDNRSQIMQPLTAGEENPPRQRKHLTTLMWNAGETCSESNVGAFLAGSCPYAVTTEGFEVN